MKKRVFTVTFFLSSILLLLTQTIFAQELVQFDFKVKANATTDNTCVTNTVTVSKDTSSPPEGESNATTQIGSATCGTGGENPIPSGWPVTGSISTLYCEPTGVETCHSGIDIAAGGPGSPLYGGQPVYSSTSGTVIRSSFDWCMGKVDIESQEGSRSYITHYVHLSQTAVNQWNPGDTVRAGQNIGLTYPGPGPLQDVDGDGDYESCSTGTHLHYTIYVNGAIVDPMDSYVPRVAKFTAVTAGEAAVGWTPQ